MKFLLAVILTVIGFGGGGFYYVQSGGHVPAPIREHVNSLFGNAKKEDVSKRSADYQLCHKHYALVQSDDMNHASRANCECFETRIRLVSPSVKKSVIERLKTDYEVATGAVLGKGRIPTMQAAWEFLASCQMLPGQQQANSSRPAQGSAPQPAQTPIPVDESAIEALLPSL